MEKLRIVVGGFIGLFPTGGAAWDYVQYPLGLKQLGHQVYYIEDTMQYPGYQPAGKAWDDPSHNVGYLKAIMERVGLAGRWAYRDVATGQSYGMSLARVREVCSSADVFINVSCATVLRDEYLRIPKRILIDSDPMFTQIQYHQEREGLAGSSTRYMVDHHNFRFTFGENIGAADCRIPTFDYQWFPTRQPVCLERWNGASPAPQYGFSSVMNWSGRKKLTYENEQWGQKDVEFGKFMDVPGHFPQATFGVVVNGPQHPESGFDRRAIQSAGWTVLDPQTTVASPEQYQAFIHQSAAEFSCAKQTYVKSNSGWFSGRSACYLAAGKPVITQDTGWSKYIPPGEGLFAFVDLASALEALEEVTAHYGKHARAAREMAAAYFDSGTVLTQLLQQVNVQHP